MPSVLSWIPGWYMGVYLRVQWTRDMLNSEDKILYSHRIVLDSVCHRSIPWNDFWACLNMGVGTENWWTMQWHQKCYLTGYRAYFINDPRDILTSRWLGNTRTSVRWRCLSCHSTQNKQQLYSIPVWKNRFQLPTGALAVVLGSEIYLHWEYPCHRLLPANGWQTRAAKAGPFPEDKEPITIPWPSS